MSVHDGPEYAVIRAAFELVDFRGLEEGNFLNDALMFAEVIREIERS